MTLLEILISTVVVGIIIAPLGAAIVMGMRTTDLTVTRLSESHDAQLVSIYFPVDVASSWPTSMKEGRTCGGAEPDEITFEWEETLGSEELDTLETTKFTVAYKILDEVSERRLVRFECKREPSDSTFQLTSRLVTAHNLALGDSAKADESNEPYIEIEITPASHLTDITLQPYTVKGMRRTVAVP